MMMSSKQVFQLLKIFKASDNVRIVCLISIVVDFRHSELNSPSSNVWHCLSPALCLLLHFHVHEIFHSQSLMLIIRCRVDGGFRLTQLSWCAGVVSFVSFGTRIWWENRWKIQEFTQPRRMHKKKFSNNMLTHSRGGWWEIPIILLKLEFQVFLIFSSK